MTIGIVLALAATGLAASAPDTLTAVRGPLSIHPVGHASLVLEWRDIAVYVDPVGEADDYAGLPPPDVILVTHDHRDHLAADLVRDLRRGDTTVLAPAACADGLRGKGTVVLENGEKHLLKGVTVEAVPMYNLTPERAEFHSRGRGNGYVLELGGLRIYVAGDTEDIPEMRALRGIDAAFLPMNLPYTMSVEQAAAAVRAFRPRVVYPYHYRGADKTFSDLDRFTELVGDASQVRRLAWYPDR